MLAKSARYNYLPAGPPTFCLTAPCALNFNALLLNVNLRYIYKEIFKARQLAFLCTLTRFSDLGPVFLFDWALTWSCLSMDHGPFACSNGRANFLAFRIKLLLNMLQTMHDHTTTTPSIGLSS
ncbi:unnamed protein product [Rhizophagus irregularis]|nr:unnamed protein product [Rhizophagus irregularis]